MKALLLQLAAQLLTAGASAYRKADAKARRQYERVSAWNDFRRGIVSGDELAVCLGFERLKRTTRKSRTVGGEG